MIKKLNLSNGTISRTAHGIQKSIIKIIRNNEKINDTDLCIIDVSYCVDGRVEVREAFLLLKKTKEELNLSEKYILDIEDDTLAVEILTGSIDVREIENYKYVAGIKKTWGDFSTIDFIPK